MPNPIEEVTMINEVDSSLTPDPINDAGKELQKDAYDFDRFTNTTYSDTKDLSNSSTSDDGQFLLFDPETDPWNWKEVRNGNDERMIGIFERRSEKDRDKRIIEHLEEVVKNEPKKETDPSKEINPEKGHQEADVSLQSADTKSKSKWNKLISNVLKGLNITEHGASMNHKDIRESVVKSIKDSLGKRDKEIPEELQKTVTKAILASFLSAPDNVSEKDLTKMVTKAFREGLAKNKKLLGDNNLTTVVEKSVKAFLKSLNEMEFDDQGKLIKQSSSSRFEDQYIAFDGKTLTINGKPVDLDKYRKEEKSIDKPRELSPKEIGKIQKIIISAILSAFDIDPDFLNEDHRSGKRLDPDIMEVLKDGSNLDPKKYPEIAHALLKRFPTQKDWENYVKKDLTKKYDDYLKKKGISKERLKNATSVPYHPDFRAIQHSNARISNVSSFLKAARKAYQAKAKSSDKSTGVKNKNTSDSNNGASAKGLDIDNLTEKELTELDKKLAEEGRKASHRKWLAHMNAILHLSIDKPMRDWEPDPKSEKSVARIYNGKADPANHEEVAKALLKEYPRPEDWEKFKQAEIQSEFEHYKRKNGVKQVDMNDPAVKKFLKNVEILDKFLKAARKHYKSA